MKPRIVRRQWLLFSIALLVCLLLGLSVWACRDALFPLAPELPLPEADQVRSITLTPFSDEIAQITDRETIGAILAALSQALPTREFTIQDFPSAPLYATLTLHTPDGGVSLYFYYTEQDAFRLELPYTGIYTLPASAEALLMGLP